MCVSYVVQCVCIYLHRAPGFLGYIKVTLMLLTTEWTPMCSSLFPKSRQVVCVRARALNLSMLTKTVRGHAWSHMVTMIYLHSPIAKLKLINCIYTLRWLLWCIVSVRKNHTSFTTIIVCARTTHTGNREAFAEVRGEIWGEVPGWETYCSTSLHCEHGCSSYRFKDK